MLPHDASDMARKNKVTDVHLGRNGVRYRYIDQTSIKAFAQFHDERFY